MTKLDLGNSTNDKIENLNLLALRKYACPKVNHEKDWYLKCLECPSVSACKVGKRATDIVENETKPDSKEAPVESNASRFYLAMKTDDPVKYLMDKGYYQIAWRARAALKQWLKRNPNWEQEYAGLNHFQKSGLTKRNATRDYVKSFLEGCDNERELLFRIARETPDTTISALPSRLYKWRKSYPEVCKTHPELSNLARILRTYSDLHDTCEEAYKVLYGDKNDEISVEDFLKETNTEEEPVKEPEKPATDVEEVPVQAASSPSAIEVIRTEFGRKKQELRKRLDYIRDQINTLMHVREEVAEQMELLDKTAELFGMRSTKKD